MAGGRLCGCTSSTESANVRKGTNTCRHAKHKRRDRHPDHHRHMTPDRSNIPTRPLEHAHVWECRRRACVRACVRACARAGMCAIELLPTASRCLRVCTRASACGPLPMRARPCPRVGAGVCQRRVAAREWRGVLVSMRMGVQRHGAWARAVGFGGARACAHGCMCRVCACMPVGVLGVGA